MFGGQGATVCFNDLHLLDLKKAPLNLQLLSTAADPPSPRSCGTLTALSVSGCPGTEVVVMFGGSQGFLEGFSNSLHILQGDGDDSVSLSDAASQHMGLTWAVPIVCAHAYHEGVPHARWGHSAVAWRGKLVIFGGANLQRHCNDTWILDVSVDLDVSGPVGGNAQQLLATWMQLLVRGVRPPRRAGHTASLVGNSLYVFGGRGAGGHLDHVYNDLWKLDLSALWPRWEELHVTGTPPAPRMGHAAVGRCSSMIPTLQ
jgi:hypothetical protein